METLVYDSPLSISDRSQLPNQVSAIPNHYNLFNPPENPIDKAVIVRAATVKNGELSEIVSATYFVGEHFSKYSDLPTLSILVQEDHFWGYEKGIYVPGINFDPNADPVRFNNGNYFERGRNWERPITIEYFDENGMIGFSQNAGIRIHGGTSRYFVNRSFRVYARSDYGTSTIEYPIFPHRGPQVHKRLKLRMSGQDQESTYFRDALMSTLMLGTEVTTEDYRPVNLFINGEYWGITNIRERFDHHYVERNFGIPRDEVEIFSFDSNNHYDEYLTYIRNTSPNNEDYFEMIQNWINLNSFLDNKIAEIFFGRWDMHWEHWRDGSDPDSKWKWVMWDFDVGMTLPRYPPTLRSDWTGTGDHSAQTDYLRPFLTNYRTGQGSGGLNYEFSTIMQNLQVRNRFLNRLSMMLNSNLSTERMLAEIERIQDLLTPVMPLHIERWSAIEHSIQSMNSWRDQIDVLKHFSSERQQFVYQHAVNFFELDGTADLELEWDHQRGTLFIEGYSANELLEEKGVENHVYWNGTQFQGIPFQIRAEADAGFRFIGWSGDIESTDQELTLELDGDTRLIAMFEPAEQFPGDEMNPEPHILANDDYLFDYWQEDEPEGSFPPHMIFWQSNINDPGLDDLFIEPYSIPFVNESNHDYHEGDIQNIGYPYRLTGRTRINALGDRGISMINTGRGRDLGAVVIALDTREVEKATVSWIAETLQANSRAYNVRLKYRTGIQEEWSDFTNQNGNIVEYERDAMNMETRFEDILLPQDLLGKPYIQLKWQYYFTGIRLDEESGQRDEIRIDDIHIRSIKDDPGRPDDPEQREPIIYPNPFTSSATVQYSLENEGPVTINIFNVLGQKVGNYQFKQLPIGLNSHQVDFSGLATGHYFIQIITSDDKHIIGAQLIR